jgi:hypothetical protein
MSLPGTVAGAPEGLIGFDIATRVNAAQARVFFTRGFRFCIRYVSRTDQTRHHNATHGTPDLSAEEAKDILDASMALMVVQHVALPGWHPTVQLGTEYGENAAKYAGEADLPPGVNLWLDLEGIAQGTSHADIKGYANAWFNAVAAADYVPGVYVGFDVFLSTDELFFDLKMKHYWRADGNIPHVSHRGYQLFQSILDPNTPQEFDRDVTKDDDLGGFALWLTSNPALMRPGTAIA